MFRVSMMDNGRWHYVRQDRFGVTALVELAGRWTESDAKSVAAAWTRRGFLCTLHAV